MYFIKTVYSIASNYFLYYYSISQYLKTGRKNNFKEVNCDYVGTSGKYITGPWDVLNTCKLASHCSITMFLFFFLSQIR